MIETSETDQPAFPAATIVPVRNTAEGMEVLLVQRNDAVRHMGGMWVFPGGRVDDRDAVAGGDDFQAAVNAAVRETCEETGLVVDPGHLLPLSHWTTPAGAKRRFATWFFLLPVDPGASIVVDGGEIVDHRWVSPTQALAESRHPDFALRLLPPTFVSLLWLERFEDCTAALAALADRQPTIYAPRMKPIDDGMCFLYEGDHAYEGGPLEATGPQHRTYLRGDDVEYRDWPEGVPTSKAGCND